MENCFAETRQNVVNLQMFVKAYFKRKMMWTGLLNGVILKEIKQLKDFMFHMKPMEHKDKFAWMMILLTQINDDDVNAVSKRMIQFLKDLQVLDTYRYNTQWLGKFYNQETI